MAHDPETTHFVVEHIGKIVIAFTVMVLGLLKVLGMREKAVIAEAVLTEKPVSQAQLLQCQMSVTEYFDEKLDHVYNEMKDMRTEVLAEIRSLRK